MTETTDDRQLRGGGQGWATWVAFAAVVMMLIGVFNVIGGLAALFSDTYWAIDDGSLILFDFTAWGVIWIIFGVLMVTAGWGLVNVSDWARWFAIFLVFWNAAAQVVVLPARPLLSLMLIAIDVLILFALTARWEEVRRAM